jgi:DNA-binding GntR family transcriptional regulator
MIAAALRTDIWLGNLKSGQPLRQDEIAARFGVSKIPVREALHQLKAEGIVTFYPNRGAVVSELSPAEVDEIYAMRAALEVTALQRALPRLTIADLARGEEILAALDQEQNMARWSELNWQFHFTLYNPANMPRLMESIKTLHFNVSRYLVIYLAIMDYQSISQAEHWQILDACRRGNIQAATQHLQQHLHAACEHLVTFLSQRKS